MNWIALLAALAGGAAVAYGNYRLSAVCLDRRPAWYSAVSALRSVIAVAYLLVLYIVGSKTAPDVRFLLIGGALGLTVPSIYLTVRLLRRQSAPPTEKSEKSEDPSRDGEKGEETDG